jgi:hypothetical protein
LLGLALFLAAGISQRANALAYTDFQGTDVYFSHWLLGGVDSYTWTFDLDNDALLTGDVNPGDIINSASLYIKVLACDFFPEFAALVLDGIPVFIGEIDTATYDLDVLAWVSDHVLSVQVVRVAGDFTIDYVKLTGNYTPGGPDPREPTIPEPATLALSLMGLSLAGLAHRRRRLVAA